MRARRALVPLVVAAAAAALVAAAPPGTSVPTDGSSAPAAHDVVRRGSPGHWTKISTGTVGITFQAALRRTGDGVLHVVYPHGSGDASYGHTAIAANGTTTEQNEVLGSTWSVLDPAPVLMDDGSGGLRVVFGGQQTTSSGFWSDGRVYTATADSTGSTWALPAEAVGISHSAYGSYGTSGTTLADGTPVAAFPLNSDLTWHVGTGTDPDQSFSVAACCVYDTTMVRDGNEVWLGWYGNGGTSATSGTFVRRIHPTLGPIEKAPGSGTAAGTGRVALVARAGGGVYAAYCTGSPCDAITLWKVGSSTTARVPRSRYASDIALAPGPGGRMWVAWADNIPKVQALRTSRTGLRMGPVRQVGRPSGTGAIYSIAMDGGSGKGNIVVNVGNAFWHTQVIPGLTVTASPSHWEHGRIKNVAFTVKDAGDPVRGARVQVGQLHCTTSTSGSCGLVFPRSLREGRYRAKATASGFAPATLTLRVT